MTSGVSSKMRFDARKAVFFERMLKAWEKRPDLTFGQLVAGALMLASADRLAHAELLRLSDTDLAEAVEKFVLTGAPAPVSDG